MIGVGDGQSMDALRSDMDILQERLWNYRYCQDGLNCHWLRHLLIILLLSFIQKNKLIKKEELQKVKAKIQMGNTLHLMLIGVL